MGLFFTGCSSDDLDAPDQSNSSNSDHVFYVNMTLRGDVEGTGSRADGDPTFDAGTNESNTKEAYFVFYDESGNVVGEYAKVTLTNDMFTTSANADGSVDKYYQSVVPVNVHSGQTPTQVVCYINPITPASLNSTLNVIQTSTREILYTGTGTNKYFAMSNSVYYPTTGDTEPQIAVPVSADQLFTSQADAEAALGDATKRIDIYVERYAAKLQFTNTTADPYVTATSLINDPAEIPVTLTFNAKRWVLNAACEESYIVKSFRQEANDNVPLANNYTFQTLNQRINAQSFQAGENGLINYEGNLSTGNAWTWNSAENKRSYWAMSPAYFTGEYPEVSSDVEGLTLSQKYYKYSELTAATNPAGFAPADANPHYFHETTVGARALVSSNPAAAMPSVILVGEYSLSLNGTPVTAGTTFYTYLAGSAGKPLVYFEASGNQGLSTVTGGESMLRRFIEQTSILFKKDAEDNIVPFDITDNQDIQALVAVLEVAAPSAAVKGDMKIAERYRTLQFKTGVNAADLTNIYVATADGYESITTAQTPGEDQINLTEANQALMQQVGFCNTYNTGAAYFNIPVKHLGWYRAGNTQMDAATIDWNIIRVGDFGVVRNHSYQITVNSITGLATGIGGLNNPIVPPADTKDYYVAYQVNILKWAVLPVQSVDL